ncbi:MAG TPA: 50S ribosomal protein L25 [Defluviitoga sp.]|nr:50S ribosomal protein L25 [Defluviitoga sp.]HOP25051.1 50S ribosomal protein L25 [Defluviitoga sp.]HPZ29203.1 50S ribosomal protein L25 [Defluviitoga sp.]HQD63110.1 50S ribosomal protein L25 [Defluviitoga sp.]
MTHTFSLEVLERDPKLKANKYRREKLIPAVVYGPSMKENKHINIRTNDLERLIEKATATTLIELNIKGENSSEKMTVFIKTIQRHKVTDKPIHLDFYCPQEGRKMNINIPITYIGEPVGVEQGGTLNIYLHEIPVEILPSDIIDTLEIDISNLEIGDNIIVEDIKKIMPESAEILLEDDEVLAGIIEPREIVEEEEIVVEFEEGEVTAEPEVIMEKEATEDKEE